MKTTTAIAAATRTGARKGLDFWTASAIQSASTFAPIDGALGLSCRLYLDGGDKK